MLRRDRRGLLRQGKLHEVVHAERAEHRPLLLPGAELLVRGAEEHRRRRIKGKHDGSKALLLLQRLNKLPVAEMHTVKLADRHSRGLIYIEMNRIRNNLHVRRLTKFQETFSPEKTSPFPADTGRARRISPWNRTSALSYHRRG